MSSRSALRQLRRLERVFAVVEPEDDWIDVLMWNGVSGGLFGHVHCRFSEGSGKAELVPCSDEEEVAILREHYEDGGRRLYGRGSCVSFAEYLECFGYLGSEKLASRRNAVIENLKGEERRS